MSAERPVERKIVSVLFADLVGFTPLSEQLDAEDVAAIQRAYFDTVRETIELYGGQLEKFIGDAAMAVFGVPRTRDDDAERAVRAGLALTAAIDQLGARVGLEAGTLAVRVGVNTGEVVHTPDAGPGEAVVTGDPVNVAARLQAASRPGQVLVGETTGLATAAVIELDQPQPLELKGKAEPVPARRAVAARPEPSREAAMGALRAPLLGREEELRRLLDDAETAKSASRRVLVMAAPGVGKTRLTEELVLSLSDAVCARARLRPDLLAPFEPVAQLFLTLGAGEVAALEERLLAGSVPAARASVLVEEAMSVLRPSGDHRAAADRESRFAAWVEALDALAGGRPGLWLVEDVHWAGGDLLAFLAYAGESPGRRLVVTTARPSLLETAQDWCAGASRLDLEPLPAPAAADLVRMLVGGAVPDELVARIANSSDGNPLFIEELLRTWIAVGTLTADDGAWTLARPADTVRLPPTVQALYAAQIDDLPPTARDVARRASVAGRRFPVAALPALEVPDGEVGVELLTRRALLNGPSEDALFGPGYAYRHALLRDAGYASLARAERARLHASLAVWLEAAAGGRSAEVSEPVARHYARALESTPALAREVAPGLSRDDCRRLAATWFERASDAALEVAAHESARTLLERSLELTADEEASERSRRLSALGRLAASTADMDEGARLLEEALTVARAAGDRRGVATAAAALSWVLDQQVQFMPAARMADAALAEIGEGDDLETALLLLRRAQAIANATDAEDAPRADAARALDIARSLGDRRLELEALDRLASIEGAGLETWQQLERLAVENRAWDKAADAIQDQALRLAPDHAADARIHAERGVELCEARGLQENLAWAHYVGVEVGLVSGDWDAAVKEARLALDLGIRNGYDRPVVRTWSTVLPIAAARNDRSLLESADAWFGERFREPESPSPYALVMMAARRLYLVRSGLVEPFVPDVEERLASFELRSAVPSWLAALEVVVDTWLAAGQLDGAERGLERLSAAANRPDAAVVGRATSALLTAKLLAARGDDPREEARRALAGFREARAPWWVAKTLRLLGTPEAAAQAEQIELALGVRDVP